MNEINELLELTGKAYIKKFVIALGVMFMFTLFEVVGFSHTYQQARIDVSTQISLGILVFIYALILLWMHHRRFRKILHEGSFNRIRILPIRKMNFVYSELLYVGSIYTMMFVCVGLALIIGSVGTLDFTLADFFYYMNGNAFMSSYFPVTFLNIIKVVSILSMMTIGTVWLLISSSDPDKKMTSRICIVLFLIVSVMLNVFANTQGYNGNHRLSYSTISYIYIIEMLLISLFSYIQLQRFFGRKEKRL